MKRSDLEARFVEILSAGGEPLDDPEIRDAAAVDAELAAELDHLRGFILNMGEMQWPELDESKSIDHITQAFEEGFRQGRTHAAQQVVPRASWFRGMWRFAAAGAAVFVGIVAGGYVWNHMNSDQQVAELRGDMQGLHELVALSMLENQSASDRLRGLQWTREVNNPGPRLISAVSSTLRNDLSPNVRLAAADAMTRFADNPQVLDALHETVMTENPFMQVQLIDILLIVRDRDPNTQDILTRLASSPDVTEVVRVKANAALSQLGDMQ